MGFGPFSSDSSSSQETVNVGGSGQYNKKSTVAQGGSVLVSKGANVGGTTLTGSKGAVTVNNTGLGASDLKSIIGNITAATPAQIQQSSPPAVTPASAPSADDGKSKYLTYGLIIAVAVVIGLVARSFLKK